MRNHLVIVTALAVLVLSSGAFGVQTYWTGSVDNNFMNGANWSTGSRPGASDEGIFDPAFIVGRPPYVPNGNYPQVGTFTFRVPGGYTLPFVYGVTREYWHIDTVNLQTTGTVSIESGLSQTGVGSTINTIANSTLTTFGGINSTDPRMLFVLTGNGKFQCNSSYIFDSWTINDCGTVDLGNFYGGGLANLTFVRAGATMIAGQGGHTLGDWRLYTHEPLGTYGVYNMAAPLICRGDIHNVIGFENGTVVTGLPKVIGLRAEFDGSMPWGGVGNPSWSSYKSGSGRDLEFQTCVLSGHTSFFMTQNINASGQGLGLARTMFARGTEFHPDNGTSGGSGLFKLIGNLQFFDNKDLPAQPCKLTINITGLGGVAGANYSQLQVNKDTDGNGGLLTGLDNCSLILNPASGAYPGGKSFTVLTSDATVFTGMHFANDLIGTNRWTDGRYIGTVTYNTNSVVLTVLAPEPATMVLLGSGAAGFIGWLRRRRAQ